MPFNAISECFKAGGKVSKMKGGGGTGGILLSNSYFSVHFENTISKSYINILCPSGNSLRAQYVGCLSKGLSFFFPFNPTHLSWNFLYINFLHTHVPLIAVSSAKSQILNFPSFPAVMARGGVLSSLFCWGWNWMATIFLSWGESTQVFVT